ncbi:MAG: NAD(P)-dependent oxidoreductase [Proteobacteria bacterium]|nr:NAD(P)-dependent oxidoreductase [Pseudomonadota bacterium]MBU1060153.1 NAD(P)-dependent oxidoreductase [Pseudomonadota bacterium]
MKAKERMAIARQMPVELTPAERIKNFDEIVAGYSENTALLEAERCLQCKKPSCRLGCPIHNDIPAFIALLRQKKFEEAYWKIRETSSMPAVCSRICPHEFQCEGSCVRGKGKGQAVAIGMLERFVVDWMVANKKNMHTECRLPGDKKVAIIGSGPAGMTVAYYLSHKGIPCTIFESLPVYGGMLTVGIPPFRLPRDIINAEIDALKNCGVTLYTNVLIGRDKTITDLKEEGFDAIFNGVGAHASRKLGIEGEETSEGVLHGVDYLRRVNLGEKIDLGKKVVVVGGGNVAIDVARTALRLGSTDVFILYRRSRKEMPASPSEIHHLEEEGVRIEFLAIAVKIHAKNGKLSKVECVRMELGKPDSSGRCRPVIQEGSNFMIEADSIIPAISQNVDHAANEGQELNITSWGTYHTDPKTLQTSIDYIFAGGDNVLGPQTAAKAVYQGKVAAESIERYLNGQDLKKDREFLCDQIDW